MAHRGEYERQLRVELVEINATRDRIPRRRKDANRNDSAPGEFVERVVDFRVWAPGESGLINKEFVRMKAVRKKNLFLLALIATLAGGAASLTAGPIDKYSLAKALPEDVAMAVYGRQHSGQEFLRTQWERVWEEIEKVRFDKDIKRFFQSMAEENGATAEDFDATWQQMCDLGAMVDWSALAEREMAFGMKMGFPTPEIVFICKASNEKAASNFTGLSGIAQQLVEMSSEGLVLVTEGEGEKVRHTLTPVGVPFPLAFTLARSGDSILIGFGSTLPDQALRLLNGESGAPIAETKRFKEAVSELPNGEDSVVFVDIAKLMAQLRSVIDAAMQMAPPGDDEEKAMVEKIVARVFKMIDIWDYAAEGASTDGMVTDNYSITVLRSDARDADLYRIIYADRTLTDPFKYVPAEAGDVSAMAGLDFTAAYTTLVSFVSEAIPDGAEHIAEWNAMQEQMGVNVERDVLSWIEGSMVSFSIPGPTPFSPAEFMIMVKVRDSDKARKQIGDWMDQLEQMVAAQGGQGVAISDAEIEGAEGFRKLIMPMLAMVGLQAPTIGVYDEWVMLGASPEIVAKTIAVGTGKAPNFSTNDRFKKEGVPFDGPVRAVSFTDLTKLGDQLGQALSMVPLAMTLAAQGQQNPGQRTLLAMMSKAGRVVRKLDFFQSSASVTTMKGQKVITHSVTRYREPAAEKPTPDSSDSSPQ
ncbi:MAG: hypothetical protein KDA32_12590 [Phycisphaerales bacterium]|nr:hypothetical protein [Phycisphaerales bacterium]